jgi:hypothetical protein
MDKGTLFWLVFIVCILFGGGGIWLPDPMGPRLRYGGFFIILVLIAILGWRVFGDIVK